MSSYAQLIINTKEAEQLFSSLNLSRKKAVIRSTLRDGLKPVLVDIRGSYKSLVKNGTGKGYSSLGIADISRLYNGASIGIGVGARLKGENYNKGWYAKFLNAGTSMRNWKSTGKSTGQIPGTSFFSKVVDAKQDTIMNNIGDNLINTLNKFLSQGRLL